MFKRSCLIAIAIASVATLTPVASNANDWGRERENGQLCALLEWGGGPYFFSTKNALKMAYSNSRVDDEVKKLEGQFGEGRVYRFFAVSDFMMKDAYRIHSLHHGVKYAPMGNPNLKGMTDSRMALDKLFGEEVHKMVMANADERFGEGAAENFHIIADQLAKDLG